MKLLALAVVFVAVNLAAGCSRPQTCKEAGATKNGEYLLYVGPKGNIPAAIYCHNNAEYLSLKGLNVFDDSSRRYRRKTKGRTVYTKIRINPKTLIVNTKDSTFTKNAKKTPLPFGESGDCEGNYSASGPMRVDLTGTGFKVAPTVSWVARGWRPKANVPASGGKARAIVSGKCGGHCGLCEVKGALQLVSDSCAIKVAPGTCQDIAPAKDGYQTITIRGKSVKVYCRKVNSKEWGNYLDVKASSNYVRNGAKWNKPAERGTTKFSKIRFDPKSLLVIDSDFTFASGAKGKFGSAGGCAWLQKSGRFNIDLSGTPFIIAKKVSWKQGGWYPVSKTSIARNRKSASGQCGGHCGVCRAKGGIYLDFAQ